jgi:chromosome segregation ATPase
VTLMPLNRLAQGGGPEPVYPKADDCRPLMQFLEFDKAHEAAVKQVFGRVLLCRDLSVAAAYAKAPSGPGGGFTCITLEGDMVNKKGAVQGGYREAAANRLVHASEIRAANGACRQRRSGRAGGRGVTWRVRSSSRLFLQPSRPSPLSPSRHRAAEIARCGEELKAAQAAALTADQRMSTLRGEEQRVSSERSAARDTMRRLETDAARYAREAEAATQAEEGAKAAAAASRAAAELLAGRVASLQAEMGTELTSTLSPAEEAELGELAGRADGLKAKLAAAGATLEAARSATTKLTSELELKLLKRQAEVAAALGKSATAAAASAAGGVGAGAGSAPGGGASPDDGSLLLREALKAAKAELAAAAAAEDAAGKALASVEAALAAATEELAARRASMEGVRSEAARTSEAIAGESVQADKVRRAVAVAAVAVVGAGAARSSGARPATALPTRRTHTPTPPSLHPLCPLLFRRPLRRSWSAAAPRCASATSPPPSCARSARCPPRE